MKQLYFITLFLLSAISLNAAPLDSAKTLYNNQEYSKALPIFREVLTKSPKDASLNLMTGVCLYNVDSINAAIPLLKFAETKSVSEASYHLTNIAYEQYRFDDAEMHLNKYKNALTKAKKEIPSNIELLSSRIMNARNMLERVEHIQIIDSVNVDRDTFFKFYKISSECGSLNSSTILPSGFDAASNTVVFQPESKTQMIWATDIDGEESIVTSSILSDGTWEKPHILDENLCNGNSNYPYIMPDGVTIYFAQDNENSIGGYDIFISRKDEDGFFQPQNMGMPYNSPFNDYMLVIDEMTGIGWWATDRNNIDGKVTIYKFIPNESRVNHSSDDENIINLAKINSIKDTWAEGANYDEVLNRLTHSETIITKETIKSFSLSMPNGVIYTSLNDFKHYEASEAMKEYLSAIANLEGDEEKLSQLRQSYSAGNKDVAQEILDLEKSILKQQSALIKMRNKVITLERD